MTNSMKSIQLGKSFLLALVLTLAVSACKHKTPPTTPLGPGRTGTTGSEPTGPGPGNAVPGTGNEGVTGSKEASPGGIPLGTGHPGWPEDPSAFASDTVYFAFDSAVIQPGEKSKLAAVADFLKANAADAVKIEGHCDERGTEEYNRALGERRALALREALAGMGIEAGRIDTISYGKDRPADSGHDDAAWKKNRRGVFILLTPPK